MRKLDRMQEERLAERHAKSFKPLTVIEVFMFCLAVFLGVTVVIIIGGFL